MRFTTVNAKIRALLSVGILAVLSIAGGNYFTQQLKDNNTSLANLSHNLRYWVVRSLLLETRSLAENDATLLKSIEEAGTAIDETIADAGRLSSREDDRNAIAALMDRQKEHRLLFGSLQANQQNLVKSRKAFETVNRNLQETALGLVQSIGEEESTAMMTGADIDPNVLSERDLMRDLLIAYGAVSGNFQALLVLNDQAAYIEARGPALASLEQVSVNIRLAQQSPAVQKYSERIDAILAMVDQNLKGEDQLFQLWRDARDGTQKMRQVVDQVQDQAADLAARTRRMTEHYDRIGARITISVLTGGILLFLVIGFVFARNIGRNLKRMAIDLNDGAQQVLKSTASLSASSQRVAEGAGEQAASIEETSSSLEEMSAMTKSNADNATEADKLAKDAGRIMVETSAAMSKMATAMDDISSASKETSKIIKTIDEIAFQTNLLALNAAVEAARAGEAGAGFAVVADEVRSLALRAAEAAKNTAEMIEGTIVKVQDGVGLVTKTGGTVREMAERSTRIEALVAEIAAASREQSTGIGQVNTAVAEMDKVVQQNAANAEESASASAEMSSQAQQMIEIVKALEMLVMSGKEGAFRTSSGDAAGSLKGLFGKKAGQTAPPEGRTGRYDGTRLEMAAERMIPFDDA